MDIDRRTMLAGMAAAAASAPTLARASSAPSGWYDRAIIIDALGTLSDPYGPENQVRLSHRAWSEMVATGVTLLRDTVLPVGNVADPWNVYQKDLGTKRKILDANPERLILVRSVDDIVRAKQERKFAVVLGTQDTVMVGPDLDRLAQMKKDGLLTIQLTYNTSNLAGDGAIVPRNGGLTDLGRATIERIEAERLLLDLSHGGARTMAEATAFAKRPLVISHTGARAVTDHPRNTSDETIKAIADKGGVVGVYFMPFLRVGAPATMGDVLAHIDHVARVAGEDHVGIGTDNGVLPLNDNIRKKEDENTRQRIKAGIAAPGEVVGVYPWIDDLNSVDRYRRVVAALEQRGWSASRLEKLMGGNFLRVYRDAWGG